MVSYMVNRHAFTTSIDGQHFFFHQVSNNIRNARTFWRKSDTIGERRNSRRQINRVRYTYGRGAQSSGIETCEIAPDKEAFISSLPTNQCQ